MLAGQQEGKFPVQFNVGSQVCSTKGSTGNYDVTKGSTGNYAMTSLKKALVTMTSQVCSSDT